jgi:peptidoglycan/LPS O-acetylase OafA/YrhL
MTLENPLRTSRVSYLTNLTPMRGIAALLTVIFHVDLFMGNALVHPSASMILHRMYLMVDFFFILSGFIMCYVYGNRFKQQVKRKDFKKFTIARFSRVYPLHFATLIFTIFILSLAARLGVPKNPILQIDNNAYSVVTNLLLLHSMNFHNWFTWVHASWSISTEWWAYMIFPFLVTPFFRLKSRGRAFVCFICFIGYACITFLIIPIVTVPVEISFVKENPAELTINVAYQYGFVRCMCGFILGMMMHHAFIDQWGKKILGNGWTMVLLAAGAFTCMHFNLPDMITVAFFPFILLCGAYGSEGINRIFSTRPFQRIGDWSFSIYLVHQPLLIVILYTLEYLNPVKQGAPQQQNQVPGLLVSWTICLVFIALTLFVSFLTYRFVENPARRWLNAKAADVSTV